MTPVENIATIGPIVVAALIPLIYSPWSAQPYTLTKLFVFAGALTLLTFLVAGSAVLQGNHFRYGGPIGVLTAAWAGWCGLAYFMAMDRQTAWFGHYPRHDGLLTYLLLVVFFFLVVQGRWRGRRLDALIMAVVGAGAVVAALVLIQAASVLSLPFEVVGGRFSSTLGSPVFLGSFLAVALVAALGVALSQNPPVHRGILLALLMLFAAALALTASRSALAAALAGSIAVVWLSSRKSSKTFKTGVVFAAAGIVVLGLSQLWAVGAQGEHLTQALSGRRLSEAFATRQVYLRSAARVIADDPFTGAGPSNFPWAAQRFQGAEAEALEGAAWRFDDAHNLWAQTAGSLGLPALVLFLAIGVITLRAYRAGGAQDNLTVPIAAIISIAVFASFEPLGIVNSVYLWLFFGIIASGTGGNRELPESWSRSALIGLTVIAVVILFTVSRLFTADVSFERGLALSETDPLGARRAYHEAAVRAPGVDVYHTYLGNNFIREAKDTDNADAMRRGLGELRGAVGTSPYDSQNWTRLALASQLAVDRFGLNESDAAREAAQRALVLAPDEAIAHRAMAAVLVSQDAPHEALNHAREAVALDPGYDDGWLWLGFIYEKNGRSKKALRAYRRVREDPWKGQAVARIQKIEEPKRPHLTNERY